MTKKLVIQVGNGVGNSDRRKLKGLRLSRNPLFYMAGTTGLEPAMPGELSQKLIGGDPNGAGEP